MKRIIRKLKILEVSGCDRPAQEPAKVVIMKRDEGSATPMTDRLADRIDDYKRIYPHLADEDHYSMAWRDLSLSDRAKVRDEASGAYQERVAEEARYRARSMRNEDLSMKNIDTGALAMIALEGAAEALRKSNPSLTREQAFSRVYQDPANRIAAAAERQAARQRLAGGAASRDTYRGDVDEFDRQARQRPWGPEGQGRRASQGEPRTERIPGFRQSLHGPRQSRSGRRRAAGQ